MPQTQRPVLCALRVSSGEWLLPGFFHVFNRFGQLNLLILSLQLINNSGFNCTIAYYNPTCQASGISFGPSNSSRNLENGIRGKNQMNDLTPMMRQYLDIKSKYPEALLLYRMGDFYEMFMEDALTASRVLDIALTSRDRQAQNPVPMCGVPYHAAESYIAKLVAAGHKIAVCDQVEDPKKAKGLVRREVTRVLTPGLIVDNQNLTSNQPNYLAAVSEPGRAKQIGLASLDVLDGRIQDHGAGLRRKPARGAAENQPQRDPFA